MTESAAPPGRAPQAAAERAYLKTSQQLDSPIPPTPQAQVLDDLGRVLPPRSGGQIPGAPRRATPSWHRLAVDRWVEAAR